MIISGLSQTISTIFFPSQTLKNAGAAQRDIQNVVQRMYVAKCFNVVVIFFTFLHLLPIQVGYLLTLYQVCLIEAVEVWPCFHVVGLVFVGRANTI